MIQNIENRELTLNGDKYKITYEFEYDDRERTLFITLKNDLGETIIYKDIFKLDFDTNIQEFNSELFEYIQSYLRERKINKILSDDE